MGKCVSKNKNGSKKRKVTLAILGLDNAGKTVTTKGLQGESLDTVAPTIGFSSVDFNFSKTDITMYDLGGGKNIRGIWKNYFTETYGFIYVVDSSEPDRLEEAKQAMWDMLEHPRVKGKPLLLLANKQDKEGAMDEIDLCEKLNLENMVNYFKCPCRVETCSAILGQGKKLDKSIKQGMTWLLTTIANNWDELNERVEKNVAEQKEIDAQERKERMERVRKIREAREKKEEEERQKNGEIERKEESEDDMIMSNPFKPIDIDALRRKEELMKAKKKKVPTATLR